MTEPRSPLDTALDLLLYLPVGLALSAAEEVPKLTAKGRAQLGGQIAMAKVLGQFAMTQGRKELSRRFSPAPGSSRPAASSPAAPPPKRQEPAGAQGPPGGSDDADRVAPDVAGEDLLVPSEQEVGRVGKAIAAEVPPPTPMIATEAGGLAAGTDGTAGADGAAGAGGLAIPGYDSLAASQVVQRLAGLAADELAAVGAYESAHRGRRTILTRVRQLQER